MRFTILIFSLSFLGFSIKAKDFSIADVAALAAANAAAKPGDTLTLREGEWADAEILFMAHGTKEAPITLRAASTGKTVFTGKSTLRIGGEHLVVQGLFFKDPDNAVGELILFRKDSKSLANHCRMTNCAVISTQQIDSAKDCHWLGLYGQGHRVDHCSFQGKTGKGTTFVVWLGKEGDGRHQIDHNYFGPRERLGKNGGETIRVGDSKTSMMKAECVVEHNLFEKCNGEAECISNKSCGNLYRGNTFLEVSGTLTLRHGNGCTVEKNVFIGNEANGTGGIRIIGEDHTVRGNYLENLTGEDARSAICLMMGIPNSPANRYFQVKHARISQNMMVNCEHSILIGLSDDKNSTLAPVDTVFEGNLIRSPKYAAVEARCALDGVSWKGNRFQSQSLGIAPVKGISLDEPTITALKPIARSEVGHTW